MKRRTVVEVQVDLEAKLVKKLAGLARKLPDAELAGYMGSLVLSRMSKAEFGRVLREMSKGGSRGRNVARDSG